MYYLSGLVLLAGIGLPAFSQNSANITAEKHLESVHPGETICIVAVFDSLPQTEIVAGSMNFFDSTGNVTIPFKDQQVRKISDKTYQICATVGSSAFTNDYKLLGFGVTQQSQVSAYYRFGQQFSNEIGFRVNSDVKAPSLKSVVLGTVR